MTSWNPAAPVLRQSRHTPDGLALAADGAELTYSELVARAARTAYTLREQAIGRGSRIGILGSRSLLAVEAVLAAAWAGATYVPLGLRWPEERLAAVLAQLDLDGIFIDGAGFERLTPALLGATDVFLVPDAVRAREVPSRPGRTVIGLADEPPPGPHGPPVAMGAEDLVYITFTSGTTGVPKGVMVAARALDAYLTALGARKAMTPADRASQFTELSFDPSVGEIFVPWRTGASLHVVPPQKVVSPARFIREQRLTIWGSAPAAIAWMRDTRALRPGSLPGLRYSSFGGEPLPLASVEAWRQAAPNSVVDNLYGPTEATVDCVGLRVEVGEAPIVTPDRGVLAIGRPHPGTELTVLGSDRRPAGPGESGELAIAGRQLAVGYLGEPERTAERFPTIGGKRWYLTGDLARQDSAGVFHHLGRRDNQIKIQGHRVELEDVEAHLRAVAGCDQVAALGWPIEDGVARSIVGFVAGSLRAASEIREGLRARLPAYMVPASIRGIPALPLNAAGKLDRPALRVLADSGSEDADAPAHG